MRQAELLAPAGSFEALRAALGAGADAVYTGGSLFGARAYADNLDEKRLLEAIDEVHLAGKKLYLTVNTLLKENELEQKLYRYLLPYYRAGLDGVLVQDFGVLSFIRKEFPDLPVHASTQMAVTGPAGARFLEQQGVRRLVAARELSLAELKEIHETTGMELEAFVHGALCYCYSGQCLMSSLIGGRSGNRGRCAQPCRLPYEVWENGRRLNGKDTAYPLNTKDMCTVELIPQILGAGVFSLKIEGRMKKPAYAAGVVEIYRKYLDLYLERQAHYDSHPEEFRAEERDRKRLFALFNRDGFNQSYFLVRNGREMMALRNEKLTGRKPEPERTGETEKEECQAELIRSGIRGYLYLAPEKPAYFCVSCASFTAGITKEGVQRAQRQPLTEARVRAQMNKTGNSNFYFEDLQIDLEENVFVPVQFLNELRREALGQLRENMLSGFRRKAPEPRETISVKTSSGKPGDWKLWVLPETEEQFRSLLKIPGIDGYYLPAGLWGADRYHSAAETVRKSGREVRLALPYIVRRDGKTDYIRELHAWKPGGLSGILVRNLESLGILRETDLLGLAILDSGMYTFNNRAVKFWRDQGTAGDTAPLELNQRELSVRDNSRSELVIYGRAPMMISGQCLKKNLDRCRAGGSRLVLRDRKGKDFPVLCDCANCCNVIYNSLPTDLAGEWESIKKMGFSGFRLHFTVENGREAAWTAERFLKIMKGTEQAGELPDGGECTKGHFKRGVE